MRSQDFYQPLKSMVMFEFGLGGPYSTQACCQMPEKTTRVVCYNPMEDLKCRLGKPRIYFRFSKGIRNMVWEPQRLQPGADLSQCLRECVACCDTHSAEIL